MTTTNQYGNDGFSHIATSNMSANEPDLNSKRALPPTHVLLCPWAGALPSDLVRYINGYETLFSSVKVTILPREHEILPSTVDLGSWSPEFNETMQSLRANAKTDRQALLVHMIGLEGMFTAAQLFHWHKESTGRPLQVKCTVEQPIPPGVVSNATWVESAANGAWKLIVGPHDDLVQQRVLATLYNKSLTTEGVQRCRFGRGAALDGNLAAVGWPGESGSDMAEKANWKIIEAAWYGDVRQ